MILTVTYQLDMRPIFRPRVKLRIGIRKVLMVSMGEVRRGEAVFFPSIHKASLKAVILDSDSVSQTGPYMPKY